MNNPYFSVDYWDSIRLYNKNDIAYLTGSNGAPTYYYCLSNNNQGDNPIASSLWTTSFSWTPSYSTTSELVFGTVSTETNFPKRVSQGINNELLKSNLVFENRSQKEAAAIMHFVSVKGGSETFSYTHPLFNGTGLNFIAVDATLEYSYNNLYNVSVLLEQTPL